MGKNSGIIQSVPQLSSAPTTPASGYSIIYPKTDGKWYIKNSDGTESEVILVSNKDATGGYTGLTLFNINFKNALNTFISFFTNSNTAARTYTFQDRNGTISDDTDLGLKVDKSSAAYTIKANNTSGTANVADQIFKDVASQSYTGTDAWNGTAPSGSATKEYRWLQVGKNVTLWMSFKYATAGSGNTTITIPMPTDCPSPEAPGGFTAGLDNLYIGVGWISAITSGTGGGGATYTRVRRNAANTGFDILVQISSSIAATAVLCTVSYRSQ